MVARKTTGAVRQRRYRDRRARGFRVVGVEVGDADISGLIADGYLDRRQRHDSEAIQGALHAFLDRTFADH